MAFARSIRRAARQSVSTQGTALWDGNNLQGVDVIPEYVDTDFVGGQPRGQQSPTIDYERVEMLGNTVALNNLPDLSFDSTFKRNDRPGRSVYTVLKGRNTTGTAEGTKRAQFRAHYPYWTPTNDGNDNEIWVGFSFYLGTGFVYSQLTASKFFDVLSFRHFTGTEPSFYWSIESEDGGLVMRRSNSITGQVPWSDGLGDDQMFVGPVQVGAWNDVVVHLKMSMTTTNALRETWVNGVYGGAKTSMNLGGSSQVRVRFGAYTDTSYLADRHFWFCNARMGTSYWAVDPMRII